MAAQIIGYLSAGEARAFAAYAADCGLDASALANLLIVRALRLNPLLIDMDPALDGGEPRRTKITAHQNHDRLKAAFASWADARGQTPTRAAAQLFRRELSERWLATSLAR